MRLRTCAGLGLLVAALSAATAEGKGDSAQEQPQCWAAYGALSFPDAEVGVSFSEEVFQGFGFCGSFAIRSEAKLPSRTNPSLGMGAGLEVPLRYVRLGIRVSFFAIRASGRNIDHDGKPEIPGVRGGYQVGQLYAAIPLTRTIDLIVGGSRLSGGYNFEDGPGTALGETSGIIGARFKF